MGLRVDREQNAINVKVLFKDLLHSGIVVQIHVGSVLVEAAAEFLHKPGFTNLSGSLEN